jgi:ribonuclease-3
MIREQTGATSDALPEEREAQLTAVEATLGVRFRDRGLLDLALRHDSFAHERGRQAENYERLEFLGDAVLNLVVGDYLFRQFPEYSEGELAKQRARLVNETALAHLSHSLGLGRFLLLGKGEEKGGGRQRPSLLADVIEAVLGAIYVDSGYGVAHAAATRWISELEGTLPQRAGDFKSQLQERLQGSGRFPRYRIVRAEGPDHAKAFVARVEVDGEVVGEGSGRSKKEAEQAAAEQALGWLGARREAPTHAATP